MVTQEVDLPLSPTALLLRCAAEPFVCVLDGGSLASWGMGEAWLGFQPRATLRIGADGAVLVCVDGCEQPWRGDPFDVLDRFRREQEPPGAAAGLGGAGGVVAALSYDLRHWVERLPRRPQEDRGVPVLHAAAYDWFLCYSYADRKYRLRSSRCDAARLRSVAERLRQLAAGPPIASQPARVRVQSDWGRTEYVGAVRAALDYIAAGDVYQVNLAQRFTLTDLSGAVPVSPLALFASLQAQHPMPFAAYVDGGDFVLVSNSPECFLTLRGRHIATCPIKGTRRRGNDAAGDRALIAELRSDPKERAEHVMIVDLERNDLGRVCETGSVQVSDFARVRTFPSLHHLVSTVTGRLRPEVTLAAVLRATFPGGSITGAPKVRAMEIIDALEPVRRSFYTGAIGVIGAGGDATFNLAIRTVVAGEGTATYHAGGGIVADSDPHREHEESVLKAAPIFHALQTRAA